MLCFYFQGLCDNIWGFSYKYAEEGEPCIVIEFDGENPNFHGNMESDSVVPVSLLEWWKQGMPDKCPEGITRKVCV